MNNAENSSDFAFLGKMGWANREVDDVNKNKWMERSPKCGRDQADGESLMPKQSRIISARRRVKKE